MNNEVVVSIRLSIVDMETGRTREEWINMTEHTESITIRRIQQ